MQHKFFVSIFFFVLVAVPLSGVHAQEVYNEFGYPYSGVDQSVKQHTQPLQGSQIQGNQTQGTQTVLQPVVVPQSGLGANAVECAYYPANCVAAQEAQTKCVQGNGTWTAYPLASVLWPGSYCQCNAGDQLSNGACVLASNGAPTSAVDPICPADLVSNGVSCESCPSGYHKYSNGVCAINDSTAPPAVTCNFSGSGNLTTAQVQAILSLLQDFGVDAATLANVCNALK